MLTVVNRVGVETHNGVHNLAHAPRVVAMGSLKTVKSANAKTDPNPAGNGYDSGYKRVDDRCAACIGVQVVGWLVGWPIYVGECRRN